MSDQRLARGRWLFEYHCYEGEDSDDAELWHHTHQRVTVLAKIGDPSWLDATGQMLWAERHYRIRFADGYEHEAFDDELLADKSEYQRPGY